MMPRQPSIDSNSSNTNNMNVNPHANMNTYSARGGGGGTGGSRGGNSSSGGGGKSSNSGMSVGDMRSRYGHHGPGAGDGGGGDSASGGGGGSGSSGVGVQGASAGASAMGDYSLQGQFPLHSGRAASGLMGSFNPAAAAAGMNPAAMNPSLYPHLAGQTALSQQGSEHLDFRGQGNGGVSGGNPGSVSQAEREEELLLNLLIARRQRQAMRSSDQMGQMGPGSGGGGPATSWTDDWMRLQQERLGASGGGTGDPYEGLPSSLQGGGESSRRASQSASARMSLGAGMGQLPNMNMNNMNMQAANQFMSDSSARLQQQRGGGMGLPMGSPQGSWVGSNAAGVANTGSMHSHPSTPRNDVDMYAAQQRAAGMSMVSNTPIDMDVLDRVPMMRPNMMYDARMAEQGGMGQNPYHQFPMGRQHGQAHLNERGLGGYGKRQSDVQLKGGAGDFSKASGAHHQMSQFLSSPQKADPEVQPPKKRRLHKKKPADMPRRPLSAYNLFFSEERERILREIEGKDPDEDKKDSEEKGEGESKPKALLRPLLPSEKKRRPHRKTHGKISFQELATKVGQRWKALPDDRRKYYQDLAQEDMKRQKKAMEEYYQKRSALTADSGTKE